MLKIGVDFDGTISADFGLFKTLILTMKEQGHDVRITTYRTNDPKRPKLNHDVILFSNEVDIPVIYTGGMQKKTFCRDVVGWVPDVWFDDQPEYVPTGEEIDSMKEAIDLYGE